MATRAWGRLVRAHAVTTRVLAAALQDRHGLSLSGYETLGLLARAEGQRMRRVDLAERLLLTPSGVTRLLEGLEREGLVERAACESDLRVSYAHLTDAGRDLLAEASYGHEGSIQAVLSQHLTSEELEALDALLGKLPGGAEPAGAGC